MVGRLQVVTPVTTFLEERPTAYQEIDGRISPVTSRYRLRQEEEGAWQVEFALGEYSREHTLVIDPISFAYCGVHRLAPGMTTPTAWLRTLPAALTSSATRRPCRRSPSRSAWGRM